LVANAIENIVVHPASIEVSSRDRVKTDKRDSLKIAKQLSDGDLKGIKVPSQEREDFRTVTRTRDTLMEDRKRVGNQLKSLLFMHGLIKPDDDRKVSKTWIMETEELDVSEDIKYCIKLYAGMWLDFDNKLKEVDKKLAKQAKQDEVVDKLYRAAPGLGALSARILANELGDMSHFSNEGGLFSYTGLTPSEYSSGEHRWQGHISRQGKPILRKILVQAAWRAIKLDRRMAEIFERISNRAGKKKAIVAVARKLIGCIRSTFISGEMYQIGWSANVPVSQKDL
jgi:transposase